MIFVKWQVSVTIYICYFPWRCKQSERNKHSDNEKYSVAILSLFIICKSPRSRWVKESHSLRRNAPSLSALVLFNTKRSANERWVGRSGSRRRCESAVTIIFPHEWWPTRARPAQHRLPKCDSPVPWSPCVLQISSQRAAHGEMSPSTVTTPLPNAECLATRDMSLIRSHVTDFIRDKSVEHWKTSTTSDRARR